MLRKITYFLTTFFIKVIGVKRIFDRDPLDVQAMRKMDVHQPKGMFYKKYATTFDISGTQITSICTTETPSKLIIYLHGGAFISGPMQLHWDAIKKMAKETGQQVWMCDYPKAPEKSIEETFKSICAVYDEAIKSYSPSQIILAGDSAGATLCILLIQDLLQKKHAVPHQLIAISPVVDASLSNPTIHAIEPLDLMLSKKGVISAKKLCLQTDFLQSARISPLFGHMEEFPTSSFYLATHDITYPDALQFAEKLKKSNVAISIHIGEKMPHIWPLLPVMIDAKEAFERIIKELKK